MPDPTTLEHLNLIGEQKEEAPKDKPPADPPTTAEKATVMFIGAGLPPVPQKLVQRIQTGEYVDMAELLPDRLGVNAGPPVEGDKEDKKQKRRQVTNILEWIQCYSIYMAVRAQKHPDKVHDMLGYQALIVEARMEYEGDGWLGYDRRFRQTAAASPDTPWAKIEPTLWNKAFVGQARAARCKYCFSLTHMADDCDWAPTPSTSRTPKQGGTSSGGRPRPAQVCYEWNHNPSPVCSFPNCKYQHICWYCSRDPQVTSKDHKAMFCQRRRRPQPQAAPGVGQPQSSTSYQRFRPY